MASGPWGWRALIHKLEQPNLLGQSDQSMQNEGGAN